MTPQSIRIVVGSIIDVNVDAIVNAANASLLGGGGVDGVIHRAAGPGLLNECRALGGARPGEARITGGHDLSVRWIIHAVGPIWKGGDHGEAELLASCYVNAMKLADQKGCQTMAFPAISAGAYAYPSPLAASVAIRSVFENLTKMKSLRQVILVAVKKGAASELRQAAKRAGYDVH